MCKTGHVLAEDCVQLDVGYIFVIQTYAIFMVVVWFHSVRALKMKRLH